MPKVSIIVPCLNERTTIQLLLDAIYRQTYPLEEVEVIIADGLSTDGTQDVIKAWCSDHEELNVRIVDNKKRSIPSGINRAIDEADGEFIIRLDAHSLPSVDYLQRCLDALKNGKGDNVGGVWNIEPGKEGYIPASIAAAAAHPLGVGGAQYRVGGQAQEVDTVPFGAFRRALLESVGRFDETLLSNEDYEYNARIRENGGTIWFDPMIQSTYFARSTFKDLSQQYFRYGYWKFQMLRRYPKTIRWRQILPPIYVASVVFLVGFSFWFIWARWLIAFETILYGILILGAGIQLSFKHSAWNMSAGVPIAIVVMHFSWGTGFLWSFLRSIIFEWIGGK